MLRDLQAAVTKYNNSSEITKYNNSSEITQTTSVKQQCVC